MVWKTICMDILNDKQAKYLSRKLEGGSKRETLRVKLNFF